MPVLENEALPKLFPMASPDLCIISHLKAHMKQECTSFRVSALCIWRVQFKCLGLSEGRKDREITGNLSPGNPGLSSPGVKSVFCSGLASRHFLHSSLNLVGKWRQADHRLFLGRRLSLLLQPQHWHQSPMGRMLALPSADPGPVLEGEASSA